MKKILSLSCVLVIVCLIPSRAQQFSGKVFGAPDSLVETVLENNLDLKAASREMEASMMRARTGITPPDPGVEFGYLYGKPGEIGHRVDFSIEQEFDFPTTYLQRIRLKDFSEAQARLSFTVLKQEVLLEAAKLWIEGIYLNKMQLLVQNRLKDAEKMLEHYHKKMDSGEVGKLAFSQVNLQVVSLRNENRKLQSEMAANQLALEKITGGSVTRVTETDFPLLQEPDPDSLMAAYDSSPQMALLEAERVGKQQERKLAVSEGLPRLTAGYYSETVIGESFRGFRAGISIPMWQNTYRVKYAAAEIAGADARVQRFSATQAYNVTRMLKEWKDMEYRVEQLEQALTVADNTGLLNTSLALGELSLSEYIYASAYYFTQQQELYRMKKQWLFLQAELLKIYY